MNKTPSKLISYLTVTAGVGSAISSANGAVTFYGVNSANDINADPVGINIGTYGATMAVDNTVSPASVISAAAATYSYFSPGSDVPGFSSGFIGTYFSGSGFSLGGAAGDQNYAHISFDGADGIYEAVAQFFFDGAGGGYLIAIATTNPVPNPQDLSSVGGPGISASVGKAMIDGATPPIPEPSGLSLLALGSLGLAARRQRRKEA